MPAPPDSSPRRRVDGQLAIRQLLGTETVETTSLCPRDSRAPVEEEWESGAQTSHFGFAPGCPIPFFVGGVGGSRPLGVSPSPIHRSLWRWVSHPLVNLNGAPVDWVDLVYQGVETPSHGGHVIVSVSRDGFKMHPSPT